MKLARSIALASATLVSACAAEGAPSLGEEPIALVNAQHDDSAGTRGEVHFAGWRWFTFQCTQRCDVELQLSLEKGTNSVEDDAPLVGLGISGPAGFERHVDLAAGDHTMSYAQLPPGDYAVVVSSLAVSGGISEPVPFELRASWIEGASARPGGSVRLQISEQLVAPRPAWIWFTCEEESCDLNAWFEFGDNLSPAEHVTVLFEETGQPRRWLSPERIVDRVGLVTQRGLPRGEHRIVVALLPPADQYRNAYDRLVTTLEWFPSGSETIEQRLASLLQARQEALGCTEPSPSEALSHHALRMAEYWAGARGEPNTYANVRVYTAWSAAPIVSDAYGEIERDEDLVIRLERCDAYGVGVFTSPENHYTAMTVAFGPR